MRKNRVLTEIGLFCIGGFAYILIELLWRGRSHWTMFLVGGTCFRVIAKIYRFFAHFGLWTRCVISAVAVTAIEFVSGCVCNLHLKMQVWDYSHLPLNIKGQVCLLYTAFWGILSIPANRLHTFFEKILNFRGANILQRTNGTLRRTRYTEISAK